jgi:hypothetical protein
MLVAQGTPHAVESVRTIIVLFATISVIFWRALLRIVLTVAAIVLVILLVSGAILVFEAVSRAK